MGVSDYIKKPPDPEALKRSVQRTFHKRAADEHHRALVAWMKEELDRRAKSLREVTVGTLASLHAQLGKSIRVRELDSRDGSLLAQHYFDALAEAQAYVRERRLETYAVGQVSLEDIYLRVMGRSLDDGSPP